MKPTFIGPKFFILILLIYQFFLAFNGGTTKIRFAHVVGIAFLIKRQNRKDRKENKRKGRIDNCLSDESNSCLRKAMFSSKRKAIVYRTYICFNRVVTYTWLRTKPVCHEKLDVKHDKDIIIPRALYATTEDSFAEDILRLESLYTRKQIVSELRATTELISNKVCEMVAQRYHIKMFHRFKFVTLSPPNNRLYRGRS